MPILGAPTIHGVGGLPGVDSPPLRRHAHALMERVASWGCDAILAQGQEDRDTVVATGAVEAAKVTVIGNGINLSRFDPATIDRAAARASLGLLRADEILFLSAGRLIVEKGFVELFAAAAARRGRSTRAFASRSPGRRTRAPTRCRNAALADAARARVILLGRREDMPRLYAASDVVVLASWHEGMPRVLIEGAAMGKPLLASDVRGCREVTPAGVGILVPVRDERALTRAMLDLAADPARRAALGAAGRVRHSQGRRPGDRDLHDELVARKL